MENNKNNGAGKGDKPRSCFSEQYRDNYDSILWCNRSEQKESEDEKVINNCTTLDSLPNF